MTATPIISTSGIYAIRNTVNGQIYVGSAVSISSRFKRHLTCLRGGSHHSLKLQRAWNKYGPDAFSFEAIENSPKESLIEREQYWINELGGYGDNGYNMIPSAASHLGAKRGPEALARMSAGQVGRKHSPEAIKNIIAAIKRRPPMSQATREKLSAANVGSKRSPESVANMAAAQRLFVLSGKKRKPASEETRAKLSANWKGRSHTPEAAAKIAAAHRGVKRPPMSEEWKAKIAASLKKNGRTKVRIRLGGVDYDSQADAARATGLKKALVCKMVKDGRAERI